MRSAYSSPVRRRWSDCRCCSANATARRGSTPPASSPAIAARRSACTTTRCGAPNRFLKQHDIDFAPGLNEDLAATAVWGSQQVGMFPGAKVDGVFGIWYGKGPGVDRSMDVLKHANSAGTSPQRRRDRAGRRRPWLPVLDAGAPERAGVRRGDDAGGQSGDAAGLSRSRHSGLCAVALLRLLGRLQGDLRDGRKLGLDRQRSRPHQDHHAR